MPLYAPHGEIENALSNAAADNAQGKMEVWWTVAPTSSPMLVLMRCSWFMTKLTTLDGYLRVMRKLRSWQSIRMSMMRCLNRRRLD